VWYDKSKQKRQAWRCIGLARRHTTYHLYIFTTVSLHPTSTAIAIMAENPAHSLSSIDVDIFTILEPAADVDALMQSHNDNIPLLPITVANRSTPPYPADMKDALIQRNENNSPSQPPRTKHWRKGWWAGVRIFAILTTCIFALNLIITIYMLAKYGTGNAGSVVVYKGQCKKTQTYSLWLHFAINAISTGLLAAGNYTMQALISPTRGEINKCHKNNDWVEIGVISFQNLRRISMDRVVLWWLLALSSLPLHLL
jgi:hypothetical protein